VKAEIVRLPAKVPPALAVSLAAVLALIDIGLAVYVVVDRGGDQLDLEVYRLGGMVWSAGGDLYGQLPMTNWGIRLPFIYPPIAAMLFRPVAALPMDLAEVLNCVVAVVLVAVVLVLAVRRLPATGGLRRFGSWPVLAGLALPVALYFEPVRETMGFGQINIVLLAMVAVDCLITSRRWPRGVLIGLAAAIKLTPLVFLLFFLLRKDYRAIVWSMLSFVVVTAVGFLGAPGDSVTYWTRMIFQTTEVVGTGYATNQSLYGVLARFAMSDRWQTILWLASSAVVLTLTTHVMRRMLAHGQDAAAMVANGVAGLLISPISWSHHWVWIVPAFAVLLGTFSWRLWLAAVPIVVIFLVGPHSFVPMGEDKEFAWSAGEHLIGNLYAITAVLVLAAIWWVGTRRAWRTDAVPLPGPASTDEEEVTPVLRVRG
jgi:alpha-1,2-mannosyltransferase